MVEVSEDIFYQVKKQILDKLDIILQKVNMEILNYVKPEQDQFTFIQLSSFQSQLSVLFQYLDRLYASLNSSVTLSSFQSFKSNQENIQIENSKLIQQNKKMREALEQLIDAQQQMQKQFQNTLKSKKGIIHKQFHSSVNYNDRRWNVLRQNAIQMGQEIRQFGKDVKKMLKVYKFEMLQLRVEMISRLKQFELKFSKQNQSQYHCLNGINHQTNDKQEILQMINSILQIC